MDRDWKYFINLCAVDFPVKTSKEMAISLKALYPRNQISSRPIKETDLHRVNRYKYIWKIAKNEHPTPSDDYPMHQVNTGRDLKDLSFQVFFSESTCHMLDIASELLMRLVCVPMKGILKTKIPHDIRLYAGSLYIEATREFINWTMNDAKAKKGIAGRNNQTVYRINIKKILIIDPHI